MGVIKVLNLPPQFRPKTSIVYPPFKNGEYLEEYFYNWVSGREILNYNINRVYIPAFWTNIQNHPNFKKQAAVLSQIIKDKVNEYLKADPTANFFTVVQHDDSVLLWLPKNTLIFGACNGDIPIPLIYEDNNKTLIQRRNCADKGLDNGADNSGCYSLLASFVGSKTHPVREKMFTELQRYSDVEFRFSEIWSNSVQSSLSEMFIQKTLRSRFCLAPRGYGRSSFRFFESMLLGCIPVYIWDDIEWLPYKELLDYSKFSVSVRHDSLGSLHNTLKSISEETYVKMLEELDRVSKWFTLEGMSRYILWKLLTTEGVTLKDLWDITFQV
jgi:hypothetical protein